MKTAAVIDGQCRLRCAANCRVCLSDPAWRQFMGTPAPCPMNVTLDSLPEPGFRVRFHTLKDGKRCATCGTKVVTFHGEQK